MNTSLSPLFPQCCTVSLPIFPTYFFKVKQTVYMSGTLLMSSKSWVEKFGKECHHTMYGISRMALLKLSMNLYCNYLKNNLPDTCTPRANRRELQISPMKSFIFYILYSQLLTCIGNHSTWDIQKWRQRKLPPYLQEILYIDFILFSIHKPKLPCGL